MFLLCLKVNRCNWLAQCKNSTAAEDLVQRLLSHWAQYFPTFVHLHQTAIHANVIERRIFKNKFNSIEIEGYEHKLK